MILAGGLSLPPHGGLTTHKSVNKCDSSCAECHLRQQVQAGGDGGQKGMGGLGPGTG